MMGISPDVGVCMVRSSDAAVMVWLKKVGESVDRRRSCVAGDSWGARCDLRLSRSIMPQAQSRRSTGVRLAAWTKGSRACRESQHVHGNGGVTCSTASYVEFLGRRPVGGVLEQALLDHVVEDLGEGVALGQFGCGLVDDLLEQIEDAGRALLFF